MDIVLSSSFTVPGLSFTHSHPNYTPVRDGCRARRRLSALGAIWVQCPAQGHFSMRTVEARIQTANPSIISSKPVLPIEQPLQFKNIWLTSLLFICIQWTKQTAHKYIAKSVNSLDIKINLVSFQCSYF